MDSSFFIPQPFTQYLESGSVSWQAPSNIALVKYWGKREVQLPQNASVSFTLSESHTTTTLAYSRIDKVVDEPVFEIFLDDVPVPDFKPKIASFFKRIAQYTPFIKDYRFIIHTSNSFPHSSGIASSASGMSALALCIMDMERQLNPNISDDFFYQKASFLARLGSGSACRSLQGPLIVWGTHDQVAQSSDFLGTAYPYEVAPIFKTYQDAILLVDKGEKQVSSTVGHGLMNGHAFAKARFSQAYDNLHNLKTIFKTGDVAAFIKIVESEALTLHAMMMTSHPYFILMKPNTLEIIQKIWQYRNDTGSKVCFTLDAGANVHMLYPEQEKEAIHKFIATQLAQYCQKGHYILDKVGNGAKKM